MPSSPIKNHITHKPSRQPQEKKASQSPYPCERTFIPPHTERRTIFRLIPRQDAHRQFELFISSFKAIKISPESQKHEGNQAQSINPPSPFNKKDQPSLHDRTTAPDPNHKKTINELETPPKDNKKSQVHIYLPTVRPMR